MKRTLQAHQKVPHKEAGAGAKDIQEVLVLINGMSRFSEGGADCSHEEAGAAPHR